jgi:hypothetical protein
MGVACESIVFWVNVDGPGDCMSEGASCSGSEVSRELRVTWLDSLDPRSLAWYLCVVEPDVVERGPDDGVSVPSKLEGRARVLMSSIFGKTLMLLPLFDRRRSGSCAVNGGLGGAAVRPPKSSFSVRSSLPTMVGSGVYNDSLGLTRFSLLPTDSLLCALEKAG